MKIQMKKTYLLTLAFILSGWLISCDESFLEKNAVGSFSEATLNNADGVKKALVGCYSWLNGNGIGMWTSGIHHAAVGSIQGGEYVKGSSAFDFLVVNECVGHFHTTGSGTASGNFTQRYTGIDRSNIVIKLATSATGLTDQQRAAYIAEARFLRGLHYLSLKINFYNIPWVDETTTNARVPNYVGDPADKVYVDIWPNIFNDFRAAAQYLPESQTELARANKWAAQCFLAKALLFAGTYDPANYADSIDTALDLFDEAITSGKTSKNEAS